MLQGTHSTRVFGKIILNRKYFELTTTQTPRTIYFCPQRKYRNNCDSYLVFSGFQQRLSQISSELFTFHYFFCSWSDIIQWYLTDQIESNLHLKHFSIPPCDILSSLLLSTSRIVTIRNQLSPGYCFQPVTPVQCSLCSCESQLLPGPKTVMLHKRKKSLNFRHKSDL